MFLSSLLKEYYQAIWAAIYVNWWMNIFFLKNIDRLMLYITIQNVFEEKKIPNFKNDLSWFPIDCHV